MDFGNERYVRLYVRDTVTWKRLGWDGQNALTQMLRKADRSGVIDLGGVEPWESLVVLCGAPEDAARRGMARCLELECIVHDGDRLVFPKYIEANECAQSDAQRQRESRAKRGAISRHSPTPVTNRDHTQSQIVTESHDRSQAVTSGHSVPCLTVPSVQEELRTPPNAREELSPFRIGHDLIRDAIGNPYGEEWRRELESIGLKPESERKAVSAAIRCDPWCKANKTSVNPTHVLKHWAKYAAGNPPLKQVVRAAASGRYAGPSRVPTAEEYAQDAKEKAPWEM